MTDEGRLELEGTVRRLCDDGDHAAATAAAIRGYGPEILGFVIAHQRGDGDADDIFALWSERLYRGLPAFGWTSSLRTWAYAIARNASMNHARDRQARARRERVAWTAELAAVQEAVRTQTVPFLRTSARDKFAAIREALPDDDRMLLVLRVDKRLEWKDLARVMLAEDGEDGAAPEITDAALTRESQRLRKRFQLLKVKLVEEGKRAGIVGGDEP